MGESKDFILSKLPTKSPIQETGNAGNTLIEYIAKEWDQIYLDIVDNGRLRYLDYATGLDLDKYGDWYGIPRNGLSDTDYRELIIGLSGGAVNISGLRNLISRVLNIESSLITIQNGISNCFTLGETDLIEGDTTNNLLQLSTVDYNVIRVTAPDDTYDLTTLRDLIYKSILAGVMVYFNGELL